MSDTKNLDNADNLDENTTQEDISSEPMSEQELLLDNLAKAEASSKEYLDKLQRSVAEFDNFRKRTISEKASMYENGTRDTVEKFLPILDNFERAMSSTPEDQKELAMYKGIDMIFNQFLDIFSEMGVKEVVGVGEAFDPNIHNAVMHIEDETLGENVVAEVLQKGYTLGDKVIRTSMVKVAN